MYYIFRSRGVAVNMPACHAGDRRFDPGRDRHYILNSEPIPGFIPESIFCIVK